jgi:inward rectifier potassium channel
MAQPTFEASPLSDRINRSEQRDRDLGFGSVVGRESRQRLLNRDGSFNVVRAGLGVAESLAPYHHLLTMSWPTFLGAVGALYLAVNLVFALLFVASA